MDQLVVWPDSNVHGANMGPTRVLSAPDGPHVGHMNLALRVNTNILKTIGLDISHRETQHNNIDIFSNDGD